MRRSISVQRFIQYILCRSELIKHRTSMHAILVFDVLVMNLDSDVLFWSVDGSAVFDGKV